MTGNKPKKVLKELFEANLYVFKENFKTIMSNAIDQLFDIEMAPEKVSLFLSDIGRKSSFLKIEEVDEEAYLSERDSSRIEDMKISATLLSKESTPKANRSVTDENNSDIKDIVLTTVTYSNQPHSKSVDKYTSKEETADGSADKKPKRTLDLVPHLFKKKRKNQRHLKQKRVSGSFHEHSRTWKGEHKKKEEDKGSYIKFLLEKGKKKFSFIGCVSNKTNRSTNSHILPKATFSSDKRIKEANPLSSRKINSMKRYNTIKS